MVGDTRFGVSAQFAGIAERKEYPYEKVVDDDLNKMHKYGNRLREEGVNAKVYIMVVPSRDSRPIDSITGNFKDDENKGIVMARFRRSADDPQNGIVLPKMV